MRLPRDISPGAASRRALLGDLLAAIALALVALQLTAGVGVAAVIAIAVILILVIWSGAGALVRRIRRRGAKGRAQG